MSGALDPLVVEVSFKVPAPELSVVGPEELTMRLSAPDDSKDAPAVEITSGPPEDNVAVAKPRVPALTVVVPEKVLDAVSINLPAPALMNPAVPPSGKLIVVVALDTATTGVPPANVSAKFPPGFRIQLCFIALRSSKVRLPMVRAAPSVTVTSAERLSVLKFAVLPEPSAITLAFQLSAVV